jgi:threonine dehydrogenase-like Zn-dependent dehydrogenase
VNAMPGMTKHDVLGHEFMGIVEDVGPEVSAECLSLGNTCTCYGHVDSQLHSAQAQQAATVGQEFACA